MVCAKLGSNFVPKIKKLCKKVSREERFKSTFDIAVYGADGVKAIGREVLLIT